MKIQKISLFSLQGSLTIDFLFTVDDITTVCVAMLHIPVTIHYKDQIPAKNNRRLPVSYETVAIQRRSAVFPKLCVHVRESVSECGQV